METKELIFMVFFWFFFLKNKALPYGLFYESLELYFHQTHLILLVVFLDMVCLNLMVLLFLCWKGRKVKLLKYGLHLKPAFSCTESSATTSILRSKTVLLVLAVSHRTDLSTRMWENCCTIAALCSSSAPLLLWVTTLLAEVMAGFFSAVQSLNIKGDFFFFKCIFIVFYF